MLDAAEKTVSHSFLCLGLVVSQSVIVSRTARLFCVAECVVCVVVYVIKNKKSISPILFNIIIIIIIFFNVCKLRCSNCFILTSSHHQ